MISCRSFSESCCILEEIADEGELDMAIGSSPELEAEKLLLSVALPVEPLLLLLDEEEDGEMTVEVVEEERGSAAKETDATKLLGVIRLDLRGWAVCDVETADVELEEDSESEQSE